VVVQVLRCAVNARTRGVGAREGTYLPARQGLCIAHGQRLFTRKKVSLSINRMANMVARWAEQETNLVDGASGAAGVPGVDRDAGPESAVAVRARELRVAVSRESSADR
jgi:hypothetical protein